MLLEFFLFNPCFFCNIKLKYPPLIELIKKAFLKIETFSKRFRNPNIGNAAFFFIEEFFIQRIKSLLENLQRKSCT